MLSREHLPAMAVVFGSCVMNGGRQFLEQELCRWPASSPADDRCWRMRVGVVRRWVCECSGLDQGSCSGLKTPRCAENRRLGSKKYVQNVARDEVRIRVSPLTLGLRRKAQFRRQGERQAR